MKKALLWFLVTLVLLAITVPTVWLQVKAENWLSLQQERYGVFTEQDRCQLKPAIVFYVEERIMRKHSELYEKAMDYYDNSEHPPKFVNWWFDMYLYHVFYEGCD